MFKCTKVRTLLLSAGALVGCASAAEYSGPGPNQVLDDPLLVSKGPIRHLPFAFNASGATLVSYSEHPDAVLAAPVDALTILGGGTAEAANFYLTGIASLSTGALLGMSYITEAINPGVERAYGWVSSDGGAHWRQQLGVVRLPQVPKARDAGWGGLLFHRRLHALADGAIVGTMYGNYQVDVAGYRSVWVRSSDGGLSWDVVSTIAAAPAGAEGYAEPVSAFCPDGTILVVMRTGPTTPLRWTRSRDYGTTWQPAADLPFAGWDPDLLATGADIVLSYGLPGTVSITRTADCGESWAPPRELDMPTTSGYSGLAEVGGRVVLFTDRASETEIAGYPLTIR